MISTPVPFYTYNCILTNVHCWSPSPVIKYCHGSRPMKSVIHFPSLAWYGNIMDVVDEIFGLYERHGNKAYLGENVSKTQHSAQCAILAEREGHADEVRIPLPRGDSQQNSAPAQCAILAEREGHADEVHLYYLTISTFSYTSIYQC